MKSMNDKNVQAEEIKIAQERMEKFIKSNYEGIHNVTFKDKYEIDPMGGIEVFGYYNGDTSNKFDGIYDKANDKIMGHSIDAVRKNAEIKIAITKKTLVWRFLIYEYTANEKDKGFGMCRPCLFLLNTEKHNRNSSLFDSPF